MRGFFKIFVKRFSGLGDKRKVEDFFGYFLTPTEQITLAKRLAIAFLLIKKCDYRMITKILRVSSSTIGSVWVVLSKCQV